MNYFSLSQHIFPDIRTLEPLTMSYESGADPSEKWLDLFNGNKTKNDWFFVQTFIIDKIENQKNLIYFLTKGTVGEFIIWRIFLTAQFTSDP